MRSDLAPSARIEIHPDIMSVHKNKMMFLTTGREERRQGIRKNNKRKRGAGSSHEKRVSDCKKE